VDKAPPTLVCPFSIMACAGIEGLKIGVELDAYRACRPRAVTAPDWELKNEERS
jgi:hypothetical protein